MYLLGARSGITPNSSMELILTAVIGTLLGGMGRVFMGGLASLVLALITSYSVLVIGSRWQNLLIYGFLFVAIVVVPARHPSAAPAHPRTCTDRSGADGDAGRLRRMEYFMSVAVMIAIFVILAASYNLVIGYGGLATVAHPIFFALGAYTAALLAIHTGLPAPLCVLAGAAVATVASVLLAASSLRVSGDYLLIASLGFQLGLLQVIRNFEWTGGPGGLTDIPATITGAARTPAYLAICGAVAVATVAFIAWIVRGPYGRAITAMRDEELAFTALGRNAMSMKIALFAIGCGIAGIAGGLYAFYFQYLSPEQFDVLQSAAILTMVVLGGMGTTWGPVVGAALLLAVPQAITFLDLPPSIMAPMQGIIFTGLVLVFLFLRPAGLIGASGRGEMPAALARARPQRRRRMTEILRLSGVCKAFGGIVVADNVNLSIDAGEILGLIGPNGAGKTSLFNLISGVVRPDAGQIMLQGEPIDRMTLYRRARAGIARTWQNMLLFTSMSVMENLLIAPRHYPGELVLRLAFGRARDPPDRGRTARPRPGDPRAHGADAGGGRDGDRPAVRAPEACRPGAHADERRRAAAAR